MSKHTNRNFILIVRHFQNDIVNSDNLRMKRVFNVYEQLCFLVRTVNRVYSFSLLTEYIANFYALTLETYTLYVIVLNNNYNILELIIDFGLDIFYDLHNVVGVTFCCSYTYKQVSYLRVFHLSSFCCMETLVKGGSCRT